MPVELKLVFLRNHFTRRVITHTLLYMVTVMGLCVWWGHVANSWQIRDKEIAFVLYLISALKPLCSGRLDQLRLIGGSSMVHLGLLWQQCMHP